MVGNALDDIHQMNKDGALATNVFFSQLTHCDIFKTTFCMIVFTYIDRLKIPARYNPINFF